jgi:hypothetical protein
MDKKFSDFSAATFDSLSASDLLCAQTDVGATNAYKKVLKSSIITAIDARVALPTAEVTVASAATTDIGAAASRRVLVTGTVTITSFGTVAAGTWRVVRFNGILTLTNNANIILPEGVNKTTAAGDILIAESDGAGVWRVHGYTSASTLLGSLGIGDGAGHVFSQTLQGAMASDYTLKHDTLASTGFLFGTASGSIETLSHVGSLGTGNVVRASQIDDTAYNATSWNGVTDRAPSMNAVRDKIEALVVGAGTSPARVYQAAGGETVTNSTTAVNSANVLFAVVASGIYQFRAVLFLVSGSATSGFRISVTGPASPTTLHLACTFGSTSGSGISYGGGDSYTQIAAASGTTTSRAVIVEGYLSNGANAGNVAIAFAQTVAEANSVKLDVGSYIEYLKLN